MLKPIVLFALVVAFVVWFFDFGGGCEEYASDYSCDWVENLGAYEVYYWRNLFDNDPNDNSSIGTSMGLRECKNMAMNYASKIGEKWNERAYVCVLWVDGKAVEKHRLLY